MVTWNGTFIDWPSNLTMYGYDPVTEPITIIGNFMFEHEMLIMTFCLVLITIMMLAREIRYYMRRGGPKDD